MWDTILSEVLGESGLGEKSRTILQKQTIDDDQPGTVLRDFATLLEFIGEEGLKTSGKHYMLPQKKLDEINERMSRPVKHRLKRPLQRSFPHLHGLFLILRASGIGIGTGNPPNGRLTIDTELVADWLDLNPTERYFTLLESWLVQGRAKIIGERIGLDDLLLSHTMRVRQKLNERRTVIPDDRFGGALHGTIDLVTVALMELFGWVRLEYRDPREGEGVNVAAVERLPFGDAMIDALAHWFFARTYAEEGEFDEPGVLQPLFQPYFSEWQRTLALPETDSRDGAHTWRVSLGKAWRRIVTPADLDLDDLAMAILDAFDFDDEHLYCFQLVDRRGRAMRIACGHESDVALHTDEVRLGDVPLPVGGKMTFLFDYGDAWKFDVVLEDVDETESDLEAPKVTARGGEAPAQYDWDDNEW